MNLNYAYDKKALIELISSADSSLYEHNLVIDFDGEVIIDPEKYFPSVALDKYRFTTIIKDSSLHSDVMIAALYDALEVIFESLNNESPAYITDHNAMLRVAA